jgi:DNA-directed RNA polymerase subunit beta'
MVDEEQMVEAGTVLAGEMPRKLTKKEKKEEKNAPSSEVSLPTLVAQKGGQVVMGDGRIYIQYEEKEEREYVIPVAAQLRIKNGDKVETGTQLTEGSLNPQDLMRIMGRHAVQQYLVAEVQKVYRSQGVNINDKHIEVITRQMLTQVRVTSSGDTKLVTGEIVDRFHYEDSNAKILAEGGEPSTALPILLGITRASLNTDSWLAAASFQETTRVLTEAAVYGKIDKLVGLKENVIIGKLIPAHNPTHILEKLETAEPESELTAAAVARSLPKVVDESDVAVDDDPNFKSSAED